MPETGLFQRIDGTRRVRGLLLPFGELSRPNLSGNEPIMFSADSITLPADPSVVTLNRQHDRFDPIGRAVALEKTPAGVVAEFEIAQTEQGDTFLASKMRKLSAEVAELVRAGASAVRSRLTGAAAVDEGAFASAALFAVADGVIAEDHSETVYTDETGQRYRRVYDSTTDQVATEDGTTTTTTTTITETTDPAEPGEGEADMANATVPSTLLASKAETQDKADPITSATFAAMVATAFRQPEQASTMLAALSDVKIDGANAVGTGAIPPLFIGEIWSGIPFARRIIPLLQHGDLTSLTATGWRWTTKPEVAEWAGNKAAVPSNTPATEAATWAYQRFAGGWDIAREFIDFGETEVINSFLTAAAGSYAKKSEDWVLTKMLAAATAGTVTDLPADVPAAIAGIVDGALALIAADARPSYALVNPADYRPLLFTKKSDVLEYLNMALGLEDGDLSGFKIVPHTGIPAGSVFVGAREAAAVHEMPGSPIRVNALDMVKGGVDEALFGYVQFRDYYAEGLQLISLTPVAP